MKWWTFTAAVAVSAAVSLAPPAYAESAGFTSPSGNIGCILSDDLLRCDIQDSELVASPAPRRLPGLL